MLDFKNHSTIIYRNAVLNTEYYFFKAWVLLCLTPSLYERVRGKGDLILDIEEATSLTVLLDPLAMGISGCLIEIL